MVIYNLIHGLEVEKVEKLTGSNHSNHGLFLFNPFTFKYCNNFILNLISKLFSEMID